MLAAALAGWPGAARAASYVVVVSGVGGEEGYDEQFHQWSTAILDAAAAAGVEPGNTTYLAPAPERDPDDLGLQAPGARIPEDAPTGTRRASSAGRGLPADRPIGHGA